MIRSIYLAPDLSLQRELDEAALREVLARNAGTLWLDFEGEPPERCQAILESTFGFHPLAVDDALHETHVPKVDDWGDYLYLVTHSLDYHVDDHTLITTELDLFLGRRYLVTHHDQPIPALNRVWDSLSRENPRSSLSAVRLAYRVLDEIVGGYLPAMEKVEDSMGALEGQLFEGKGTGYLERIFTLKRTLLRLRRILAPQREVLSRLARDANAVIDAENRVFFRDIYDHLVRLYDIGEGLRDMVNGAMELHLSAVNNRMNQVMKTLTLITTLFMPLAFITGFFGMNFFGPVVDLPAWTGHPMFLATLAALVFTPLFMYLWMRRRGLS